MADLSERRYMVDHLLSYYPTLEKEYYSATQCTVAKFWHAVFSPNLFSNRRFLIYDHIDQLKKVELDELAACVRQELPSDLVLILSGSGFSGAAAFYQKVKQELMLFDLSLEKPWDRKERLIRWLIHLAGKEKKVLTPPVAKQWLEKTKSDFTALCSELDKWIAFAGNSSELKLSMLEKIESEQAVQVGWKLSEALLWERKIERKAFEGFRLEDWQALFGQLRYQLRVSLCLSTATRKGKQDNLEEILPNLRSQQVAKYRQLGVLLSERCMRVGLQALAECDRQSRLGVEPFFLLTHFMMQLRREKNLGV